MVKEIGRIRCPTCGHLVFLRNIALGVFHRIEVVRHRITSLGRGKIRNVYVKEETPPDLIDFWILRLKEVISYLEKEKSRRNVNLVMQTSGKNSSIVLGTSVSNRTVVLKSSSTPTLTWNVKS